MACCQRAPVFDAGEEGGYVILFTILAQCWFFTIDIYSY
jgi:hypothetical protein